ncbi:DNA-processing protein DprA [Paraglaciecola chathamensis]|jgi:predicted Rossmann fold nucleotide-binding protein DprA/Smf involved in DNA uptake|uniref:Smf/DprA SLOG domain-containing protein n=1 Tax=Paraglaciecola chathamensis TaxID=368405 RepID=A0A8H9IF34_9ALTE|nr:DNA-processing protein DprA [Paraglaciecola oceanifecundans]GGZ77773.1 hypothetical protein GCM10011274_39880 [Paraglaciecola oceanifecundans]
MLTKNTQAILLLTSYFSKASLEKVKPLTTAEWAKFAYWLREQNISPERLLSSDVSQTLKGWYDSKVTKERIKGLLSRGHSLAIAVEKWTRAGIWILTRSDPDYPKRFKSRLKTSSPPVLYGCGNIELLNKGGVAVVGSRNASEADLYFAEQFGTKAASEGVCTISGASRGVDEAAMLGAVNSGGSVVGVLSEDLYRTAISKKWRQALLVGNAVLISPFYPEAGFSAGNAMGRNKYIYCLADCALVVHSGKKGGTIGGAEENLRNDWVPLWVNHTADRDAANADLVANGGRWLEADSQAFKIADLIREIRSSVNLIVEEQVDLFSMPVQSKFFSEPESKSDNDTSGAALNNVAVERKVDIEPHPEPIIETEETPLGPVDFYQLFTNELQRLAKEPVSLNELIESLHIHKSQITDWLKRAEEERLVKKLSRPVRYQIEHKK